LKLSCGSLARFDMLKIDRFTKLEDYFRNYFQITASTRLHSRYRSSINRMILIFNTRHREAMSNLKDID